MSSLQGQFLVASPHLTDPNFFRSVVLVVQHDEEGAFGLILNRPTQNRLSEIWDLISSDSCPAEELLFHGGPVDGPLTVVHQCREFAESEIVDNVFFATDKKNLCGLLEDGRGPIRIFAGYSGWSGGQLECEMESGGWLTASASQEEIFQQPNQLWKLISQQIGLDVLAPSIQNRRVPDDPSVN